MNGVIKKVLQAGGYPEIRHKDCIPESAQEVVDKWETVRFKILLGMCNVQA